MTQEESQNFTRQILKWFAQQMLVNPHLKDSCTVNHLLTHRPPRLPNGRADVQQECEGISRLFELFVGVGVPVAGR